MSWATILCVDEQFLCFILKKNCQRDTKTLGFFILSWCLNIGLEHFFVLLSSLLIQQSPLQSDTAWMERKVREKVERRVRVKDYNVPFAPGCAPTVETISPGSEDWIKLQLFLSGWKPLRVRLFKKSRGWHLFSCILCKKERFILFLGRNCFPLDCFRDTPAKPPRTDLMLKSEYWIEEDC